METIKIYNKFFITNVLKKNRFNKKKNFNFLHSWFVFDVWTSGKRTDITTFHAFVFREILFYIL